MKNNWKLTFNQFKNRNICLKIKDFYSPLKFSTDTFKDD